MNERELGGIATAITAMQADIKEIKADVKVLRTEHDKGKGILLLIAWLGPLGLLALLVTAVKAFWSK